MRKLPSPPLHHHYWSALSSHDTNYADLEKHGEIKRTNCAGSSVDFFLQNHKWGNITSALQTKQRAIYIHPGLCFTKKLRGGAPMLATWQRSYHDISPPPRMGWQYHMLHVRHGNVWLEVGNSQPLIKKVPPHGQSNVTLATRTKEGMAHGIHRLIYVMLIALLCLTGTKKA